MGNITTLGRRPTTPESCVVANHVYLVLTRDELADVVNGLHQAGKAVLAARLEQILRRVPN